MQGDIKKLLRIRALIVSASTTDLINTLKAISQFLHDIQWNMKDSTCVRNVHGYRNRHENRGNERNQSGAKIHFEVLGRLHYYLTQEAAKELLQHRQDVLVSLTILKQKIDFLLQQEKTKLPSSLQATVESLSLKPVVGMASEDSDMGFLLRFSAKAHDVACLNKLLEYLNELKQYKHADFTTKAVRYSLGYHFCLLGETAKELSDYIKVENHKKDEANLTRFMFTKLGRYRQTVKDRPHIIVHSQHIVLYQMHHQLLDVEPQLRPLIAALLKKALSTKTVLYHQVNQDDVFATNYKQVPLLTEQLNTGLSAWVKKEKNIAKELKALESLRDDRCKELAMLAKNNSTQKSSDVVSEQARRLVSIKQFKQVHFILKKEVFSPYLTLTLSDIPSMLKKRDGNQNKDEVSLLNQLGMVGRFLGGSRQAQFMTCLKTKLDFNILTLGDIKGLFDQLVLSHTGMSTEIVKSRLESKIQDVERLIVEKKAEREDAIKKITFFKTLLPPQQTQQSRTTTQQNVPYQTLQLIKINAEIKFIETLKGQVNNHVHKARKLSLAMIGQYCRNMRDHMGSQTFLVNHINRLLEITIQKLVMLRSKKLMHNASGTSDETVKKTILHTLLPITQEFESLYVLSKPDEQDYLVLAEAFMRLGHYDQVITLLQKESDLLDEGKIQFHLNIQEVLSYKPELAPFFQVYQHTSGSYQDSLHTKAYTAQARVTMAMLMMNCYLCLGQYQQLLAASETAIQVIGGVLAQLRIGAIIGLPPLFQETLGDVKGMLIYARVQRSYALTNLDRTGEARQALLALQEDFKTDLFDKKRHASLAIRLFIDLCYQYYDNIPMATSYLHAASALVPLSEERLVNQFNALFRRYELGLRDVSNVSLHKETATALSHYFYVNKPAFKKEYGHRYYYYKMEVVLAKVNCELDLQRHGVLLNKIERFYRHVTDIVVKNKYFISRLIYEAKIQNKNNFTRYLKEFIQANQTAETEAKIIANLRRIITALDNDKADYFFNQCAVFFKRFTGQTIRRTHPSSSSMDSVQTNIAQLKRITGIDWKHTQRGYHVQLLDRKHLQAIKIHLLKQKIAVKTAGNRLIIRKLTSSTLKNIPSMSLSVSEKPAPTMGR